MAKWRIDARAQEWIVQNLNRRVPADMIAAELLKKSASLASLREFMAEKAVVDWDALVALETDRDVDHAGFTNARLTQPEFAGRARETATDKAQIYVLDNFLTDAECDGLVDLIRNNLRAATIITDERVEDFRTSRSCDLGLLTSPLVAATDTKIADALGIPLSHSEDAQGQHYDLGGEYKVHGDFFIPGQPNTKDLTRTQGNRTWTFMIYLNTVPQGGGTSFPQIPLTFAALKGRALAWNNLYPDGAINPDTVHAGLPVEAGSKTIITKWFRERAAPG
jgi:prolyl 4-hydroxylase